MHAPVFVLLASALLASPTARAENAYAESVDWLVHDAGLVVRGQVRQWSAREVVIDHPVPLLGSVQGPTVTASVPDHGCDEATARPGDDVLLLLREAEEGWVARCVRDRAEVWSFDLASPEGAYTADGQVLTTGSAVWRHLETALARPVAGAPHPAPTADERYLLQQGPMFVDAMSTAAWGELFAGSAVYLGVPPYEDLRDDVLARSRSEAWSERRRAARQLANYPGPQTERRLRELLADPFVAEAMDPEGQVVRRSRPVREAAARSLAALGVEAGDP